MTFRLTHIHDYHRFLSVDLGLYKTRVGIYDITTGSPQLVGFSSVRQSRKNWSDGLITDISAVTQSIEQAILQASQRDMSIPDDLIISFPSRNFISDVITTQYLRDDYESILTMQEIDMMIKKIEKDSMERARRKSKKQFGVVHDDLRLVSSTIVEVQIDGRKVSSPIGFSGARVRLTVLNIFVPSGEFNIIRSLLSNLQKHTLSLIPQPLILPKLIENIPSGRQYSCIVDIGYSQTTVTILLGDEIRGFEIFSHGAEGLLHILSEKAYELSLLQIENLICNMSDKSSSEIQECIHDFLLYESDFVLSYLSTEFPGIKVGNVFLHGSIFENQYILHKTQTIFEKTLMMHAHIVKISKAIVPSIHTDHCMISGLASIATELLLIKKDPLVRILRYVLYQYE